MDTDWIDDADNLRRWCEAVDDGPLAVDTESDHFHAYQARICLIQLAVDDTAVLVDPLALDPVELRPLFDLFEHPGLTKVLHAARNDINELDRDYGVGIRNLFDTRTAARFLDYEQNGLSWLLGEVLDVDDGASMSRYDWSTRPLDDRARRYAADDVHHLLELRRLFETQLEDEGWDEPFRQRCAFVARSVEFRANDFDPEGWRDIDGIERLDGRGRAAARRLYRWRHRLLSRVNQSAVTTFPDRALLELADRRPRSSSDLRGLSKLPETLLEDHADELVELLEEARTADAPPAKAPDDDSSSGRPPADEKARYDALRTWRNETADRLKIPSEFVATNATFSKIAADPPRTLDELAGFDPILDWHLDLFGDEILEVLASRRES